MPSWLVDALTCMPTFPPGDKKGNKSAWQWDGRNTNNSLPEIHFKLPGIQDFILPIRNHGKILYFVPKILWMLFFFALLLAKRFLLARGGNFQFRVKTFKPQTVQSSYRKPIYLEIQEGRCHPDKSTSYCTWCKLNPEQSSAQRP